MNNGKYHTEQYKALQEAKNDKRFGPIIDHIKICECCNNSYIWNGREKTKAYKNARFCSRSCANNRKTWWVDNAVSYRTIAFNHWKQECAICGFDKIVSIHHIDENHENNNPTNLIPLCPNHHEMVHSKWKNEVIPTIAELVKNKWGIGEIGITQDLHS
jgi:hypothetical protein